MSSEEKEFSNVRGRPKLIEKRHRRYVYLTADEEARVRRAAGDEELSIWIRRIILEAARKAPRSRKPTEETSPPSAPVKKRPPPTF